MKDKVVQIRFEREDFNRLKREASECGLTVSAYSRLRLLGGDVRPPRKVWKPKGEE